MISIYLQTPYKVLSINEIKTKDKEREEQNSPTKLFRAENSLNLNTIFRKRQTVELQRHSEEGQKPLNNGSLKKTKT
eukprot:CAMPEP_0170493706 /NCGR_PEP_ID=MMETSP0208-20121228/14223_1 /TAXON_ID=197538 /ORGANISM="Strombidium inclinatum, Strain S3" /LENGTH=76 /DNA_ID=CAMNT_0010769661 /DNA_START=1881 /DNA_END=2111 /DNA_ORIENTATION=-